jgi:perosamine synthetase
MEKAFVPVNRPLITGEDIESVNLALSDGWISGEGPFIEEFEKKFASFCHRKYGVTIANGTLAIDILIDIMELSPGDEVIIPSFTIISCINQILRVGAVPIFVDSDPLTWNMATEEIEDLITSRTKLIFVPHIYGLPADMDKISEIAEKHGIPIIEDAAEAHGLTYKGKICGSFGIASTFSFYANKNITTGEGGMILTDDHDLALKIRNYRNLNFDTTQRFKSNELGINGRLSSLQSALGIKQIERIDSIITKRLEIAKKYREAFADIGTFQLPIELTGYAQNHYWVFGIVLKEDWVGKTVEAQKLLFNRGIGTRPFFQSLHLQPVLAKYGLEKQRPLAVTENLSNSGFYIPNGLGIHNHEVEYVVETILEIFQ